MVSAREDQRNGPADGLTQEQGIADVKLLQKPFDRCYEQLRRLLSVRNV